MAVNAATTGVALPGKHFVRNLFAKRMLIYQLVRRDFEQRFVGSAAGWLWGLIHPVVLLASWVFIFQFCLHQKLPPNEVTQNYSLFLFCGFLPWMLFQDTVQRSSSALLDHASLIKKTVFPSEIVPVSVFLSSLLNHLLAVILAVIFAGVYLGHLSLWLLTLPVYILLIGMFAIGVGWIVSSLHVYLRDTAQVLSVVLTFWFWITPIFIDEQHFPKSVRFLLRLNPLALVVRAYRERLLSFRFPNLHDLFIFAAYSIAAFVIGGLFFRQLKRGFADVL